MGRHDWYFGDRFGKLVDFSDKKASATQYVSYMLNRTQSMFKYTGLPDSLPQRNLELMLQTNGFIAIPIPEKVPALKGNSTPLQRVRLSVARGTFTICLLYVT